MKSLNWKKGLVRLWIFATIIWVIYMLVILAVMQNDIYHFLELSRERNPGLPEGFVLDTDLKNLEEMKTYRNEIALFLFLPLAVLAITFFCIKFGRWIIDGFVDVGR